MFLRMASEVDHMTTACMNCQDIKVVSCLQALHQEKVQETSADHAHQIDLLQQALKLRASDCYDLERSLQNLQQELAAQVGPWQSACDISQQAWQNMG